MMKRFILLLPALAFSVAASAQVIGSRAALTGMLTSSTTDDFEKFDIGDGAAVNLDVSSMDSTTIANGQGPGLVNPGATYSDPSASRLQWNGNHYFDISTKTILANGGAGSLRIDYAGFTQAMGLDARCFVGFGYSGTMDVYNGATLVSSVGFGLAGASGESAFVGYRNDAGITHVIVSSPAFSWSPVIDDHTYGVVPEPVTMLAMATGLAALAARRRRS